MFIWRTVGGPLVSDRALLTTRTEIIQQSKARSKPEFLNAFTPLISEGTEVAYKGCSPEIQKKIRRVVEVWRERSIFAPDTQSQIEQRIDGKNFAGLCRGRIR